MNKSRIFEATTVSCCIMGVILLFAAVAWGQITDPAEPIRGPIYTAPSSSDPPVIPGDRDPDIHDLQRTTRAQSLILYPGHSTAQRVSGDGTAVLIRDHGGVCDWSAAVWYPQTGGVSCLDNDAPAPWDMACVCELNDISADGEIVGANLILANPDGDGVTTPMYWVRPAYWVGADFVFPDPLPDQFLMRHNGISDDGMLIGGYWTDAPNDPDPQGFYAWSDTGERVFIDFPAPRDLTYTSTLIDGADVVVGIGSLSGTPAWYSSLSDTWTALPHVYTVDYGSTMDLSPDGRWICGDSGWLCGDPTRIAPVIWSLTPFGAEVHRLPAWPGNGETDGTAEALSDDGTVAIGYMCSTDDSRMCATGDYRDAIWELQGDTWVVYDAELLLLADLGETEVGTVNISDISGDGEVIVGTVRLIDGNNQAFAWRWK